MSELEKLEHEIEDLQDEVAVLRRYKAVAEKAVDKLVDLGVIDPTPHARYLALRGKALLDGLRA